MIQKNDYLLSIDLSDAFLHIALHPDSRRFLRLKWRSQVYQYSTAAFGLATIPFIFTKICRPILEWARSQGMRISAYLDDWILVAKTKEQALQQGKQVVEQLQKLGWIVNFKKSVLQPTQQLEHLGFSLNTKTMQASLPPKKLRDLRRSIKQILDHPQRQTPRVLHSITMRIQAATFAIFPARLYTRHLLYYKNQTVKSDKDWDLPVAMDQASLEELQWWYHNLKKWNGRSFLPTTPTETVYVDASNTGWGCSWKHQKASGYWTHEEASQSINWRELAAAFFALKTFQIPTNSTILIRTDNTTSLSYINNHGGTRSLPMLELATQVWNWCIQHNIMIQAQHIKEPMANPSACLPANQPNVGTLLDRPLRRQDNQVVTKVRVLATGSGRYPYGCIYDPMEHLDKAIHKPTLEPDLSRPTQDSTGETSSSLPSSTVLAERYLVPSSTTAGSYLTLDASPRHNSNDLSQDPSPSDSSELDALRVAIIRDQLLKVNLNEQAIEDLLAQK
ncbi:hypothetical protein, partial, partial [Parasitella parasitica]